jgi:hypothetical protein
VSTCWKNGVGEHVLLEMAKAAIRLGDAVADGPELACVVLSLGNPPELVDAVRSLTDQQPSAEIVVVNSGGGAPERSLKAAGLDVPVITRHDRLLPGGARNLGIEATSAPFVAFLASDCMALPGWVDARLSLHRAGAPVVGHVLRNAFPASRSACAQHLLLHHRLLADTEDGERLFFGLSYARPLFERFGVFRTDLHPGEDTEFNQRLSDAGVPMTFSPEVRTIHRYATAPLELVRDQFSRGAQTAIALRDLGAETSGWGLAAGPMQNVLPAYRQARRATDAADRRCLLRAVPLLPPAALATSLGNVTGLISCRLRRPPVPRAPWQFGDTGPTARRHS